MRVPLLASLGVAVLLASGPISAVLAQDAAGTPTEEVSVLDTARHYLETLYSFDWEAVRPLMAEDFVFEDPTSAFFGGEPWRLEGSNATLEFFAASSQGVDAVSFEVRRSFSTGEYAIFELVYHSEGDGVQLGHPGVRLTIDVAGTTIIRVRDGTVVHHLDHVDYASMMRQVEAQTGKAETTVEN